MAELVVETEQQVVEQYFHLIKDLRAGKQAAIQALGSRVQRSTDLGVKNSEAIGGMAEAADQVFSQATSLREMVGQFQIGQAAVGGPGENSKSRALEEPEALALSS